MRIVIAGGGTGGHLYPGIALAKALMKHDTTLKITFVGTRHGIEATVVPREGFPLKIIAASGLIGKRGLQRGLAWLKLPVGFLQSLAFLAQERPRLAIGVGGYASGPLVLAAWVLRIPTLIHEQNLVPGFTNAWLGKIADRVAVSFAESIGRFPAGKATDTGNMIREEFCRMADAPRATADGTFRILVLGGSQGAHSINTALVQSLARLGDVRNRLHFIHQTGKKDHGAVARGYAEQNFSADVRPFFFDMEEQYRVADLVICRAGASTLAEVTACGKPAILIPFPHAAHNHQTFNADALEKAGASEVITDAKADGATIADAIRRAVQDPAHLRQMAANSLRLGRRDATERVKQLCLELMGRKAA
jgi:UDP-N-acetylglucosamine--N-acetylmuramyl-(pentapeptide) pyrophosphoryl-undecaprenol N-acetylglucosamine transferase